MTIHIIEIPQRIENTQGSWRYRGVKFRQNKNTRSNLHWWVSLDGQTYKVRTKADVIGMIDHHLDN